MRRHSLPFLPADLNGSVSSERQDLNLSAAAQTRALMDYVKVKSNWVN